MFKFKRGLCAALVGLCVATVYAATVNVKIKDINPVGAGVTENPNCDGMAMFHFKSDTNFTEVKVNVTDFMANTTYGVLYEDQFGGGSDYSLAITTNPSGNGHFHDAPIFGNVTSNPRVIIYIDENSDFTWTPGEERGCGGFNCNF